MVAAVASPSRVAAWEEEEERVRSARLEEAAGRGRGEAFRGECLVGSASNKRKTK